jgi:hypothetical protein
MTILFLDYDGVLHPDPCADAARLFEQAPRLADELQPFAEVEVVLSTAWRTHLALPDLVARLPPSLRARVVGVTPCFHQIDCPPARVPYRRQAECLHWIEAQRPGAEWFALDDRPSGFEPYCERLIATASAVGLDDAALNRLRFALLRAARQRAAAALA